MPAVILSDAAVIPGVVAVIPGAQFTVIPGAATVIPSAAKESVLANNQILTPATQAQDDNKNN